MTGVQRMGRSADDRIAALDGLRGIAIILVLMLHFVPDVAMPSRAQEWFKKLFTTSGWIGVDLFFVLSGFLITSILLKAKGRPNYFLNFYARRALRILPLYYGALLVVFVVLPAVGLLDSPAFEPIRQTQIYHWLFISNVGFWLIPPPDSAPVGLVHFWSLAVEEHFYLLWPAVVVWASARRLMIICACVFLTSLAIRCIGFLTDQPLSFYFLTPSRLDGLAAGSFVAVAVRVYGVAPLYRYALAVAIAGSTILATAFIAMKGLWQATLISLVPGLSVLAVTFAAILVLALRPGVVASVLNLRGLRFFGTYSYGLYVSHGLIGYFLGTLIPTGPWQEYFSAYPMLGIFSLAIVKICVCTGLAILSWELYEKQFLKLKTHFEYGLAAHAIKLQENARSVP